MAVEKRRGSEPRSRSSSKVEELLENLVSKMTALEEENKRLREAPDRSGPRKKKQLTLKQTVRGKLKKVKGAGTGSKFWEAHKPITIRQADADTGRYYKSMDGSRIRVFFVNKNFPQAPVIGALEIEPGVWDCRVWNYDGGIRVPYGYQSNIVGFWEE